MTILDFASVGVKRDESRAGTYFDETDTSGEAEEAIEMSLVSSLLSGGYIKAEVVEIRVHHIRLWYLPCQTGPGLFFQLLV